METKERSKLVIPLKHFIKDNYALTLNQNEKWLMKIFDEQLAGNELEAASVKGKIKLHNISGNVSLEGRLDFDHHPLCARCGEKLSRHERINFNAHFTPVSEVATPRGDKSHAEDEELELSERDMNFCFYSKEEIELDPFINDEIAMVLPYNYYCHDQKACEQRLALQMSAARAGSGDPRFQVLKDFRLKNQNDA
jgi:uncharacterized metal-binding protein YceD (DUF177 family)